MAARSRSASRFDDQRQGEELVNEFDVCRELTPRPLVISPKDFDLDNCGVPEHPEHARYVDLYTVYAYSNVLAVAGDAAGGDILLDEKKVIDCKADFYLHKITTLGATYPSPTTGYYVRFQWPNGRYSSQVLQDAQTFLGVCYTKNPDGQTVGIRIPAGRFIGIGLQNLTAAIQNVTILFEGVSRFYLCQRSRN